MTAAIGYVKGLDGHPELDASFTYVWLEGRMEAKLDELSGSSDWNDLRKWPSGRIFGEKGEYQWQTDREGKIHGVLILDDTDAEGLPEPFTGRLAIEADGNAYPLVLWGEWVDAGADPDAPEADGPWFYARELPDYQYYPIPEKDALQRDREKQKHPCIVARRYRHETRGEFIRFMDFKMETGGRK